MNNDTKPCTHCSTRPSGDEGHRTFSFYVDGPFPGQRIYRCTECDERWIRHGGPEGGVAWTRYSERFPVRKPLASSSPLRRALA